MKAGQWFTYIPTISELAMSEWRTGTKVKVLSEQAASNSKYVAVEDVQGCQAWVLKTSLSSPSDSLFL